MPHETTWEKKGVYWKFYGIVTVEEVNEANEEAYGNSRFDELKYFIWDGTDIKQLDLTEEDADISAATDRSTVSYKPIMKGALVANKEAIRKFLERYIDTSLEFGSTWGFKLFDCIEDARKWVSS